MQELKNEHKIERKDENAVLERVNSERVLTNQEVYNFYVKLKTDRLQLEQSLAKNQQNIEILHKRLEDIDVAIKTWMPVALECEKKLHPNKDKPLVVKDVLKAKGGEKDGK